MILKRLTRDKEIARTIIDLGAIPDIVSILDDKVCTLQKLSAEVIANLCKVKKTRKIVRKTGGLPKLVNENQLLQNFLKSWSIDDDSILRNLKWAKFAPQISLLEVPSVSLLKTRASESQAKDREIIDVVEAACKALWSVSVSDKNKLEIHRLHAIKHFAKLLRSYHEDIKIATLGVITQCATLVSLLSSRVCRLRDLTYYLRFFLFAEWFSNSFTEWGYDWIHRRIFIEREWRNKETLRSYHFRSNAHFFLHDLPLLPKGCLEKLGSTLLPN